MSKFKVGDVVRVIKPEEFVGAFAKKVTDREAIIDWIPPSHMRFGGHYHYCSVIFQKRNGRGKEFRERINERDLELVRRP